MTRSSVQEPGFAQCPALPWAGPVERSFGGALSCYNRGMTNRVSYLAQVQAEAVALKHQLQQRDAAIQAALELLRTSNTDAAVQASEVLAGALEPTRKSLSS